MIVIPEAVQPVGCELCDGRVHRARASSGSTARFEVPRPSNTAVPNVRANANMNNSAWEYIPNDAVEVRASNSKKIGQVRLTSQATPRHKFSFFIDWQGACEGSSLTTGGGCLEPGDDWIALGERWGFDLPRGRPGTGTTASGFSRATTRRP